MQLLILESPNKIRDVQKYTEEIGQPCVVKATYGHILDLPPMSVGVCVDLKTFSPTHLVPRDDAGREHILQLQQAIAKATKVIVATDPDREGEAIAAEIWSWIPASKACRATFEEITLRGVQRGLANISPTLNRGAADAASARRIIDRLAGWNATSVVFDKLRQQKGVSAGRLQSAALRLVVERFRDNQNFKPLSTYGLRVRLRTANGQEFTACLLDGKNGPRVFQTQSEAQAVARPNLAVIAKVEATKKQQKPRPPFEATSWLQVAQKTLRLNVKDATAAIQALFEQGHTTYPRTDTVRVSPDGIQWARDEITRRLGADYLPPIPWEHKDSGNAQGAHEAIRPTIPHQPADLDARQAGQWASAYALIEARFLASQAAARIIEQTKVLISADGMTFEASGQVELFPGWKRLLATDEHEESDKQPHVASESEDESESLPPLHTGDQLSVVGIEVTTNTTRPKPLFNQASLVAELKRLGIGRPSTYPTIVPLLLSRGWVIEQTPPTTDKRRKKADSLLPVLVPQAVAFSLSDFLATAFPSLVDYEFTAAMEAQLDEIEAHKTSRLDVASTWWARFEKELCLARLIKPLTPERLDLGRCPKCTGEGRTGHLRLIKGVSPKNNEPYEFAGCDQDSKDRKPCGFTAPTQNGSLIDPVPCPACGTRLRPVRRKDGGHSLLCGTCPGNKWHLADSGWKIVDAPVCPKCKQPMAHRERSNHKGQFFWGCFSCKQFMDSDVFGASSRRR